MASSSVASRSSIFSKTLRRVLPLVILPVVLLAATTWFGIQSLRNDTDAAVESTRSTLSEDVVATELQTKAQTVADGFTVYMATQIAHVRYVASIPSVVAAARDASSAVAPFGGLPIDEVEAAAPSQNSLEVSPAATEQLQRDVGTVFAEIFMTEANGLNIASTGLTSDFVQSDEIWWQNAWETGLDVSEPAFDESAGLLAVDISVRVDDPATGDRLGVIKAVLNIGLTADIAAEAALDSPDTVIIADADGRALATATASGAIFGGLDDTPVTVSNPRFAATLAEPGTAGATVGSAFVFGFARLNSGDLGRLITDFDSAASLETTSLPNWTVYVERPTDVALEALSPLTTVSESVASGQRNLTGVIALTVLGAALLAAMGAWFVGRGITNPIRSLVLQARHTADVTLPATVAAIHDLETGEEIPNPTPISIKSNDELGDLADAMNSLQVTATDLAAEEATVRRQRTELFLNLGRRNQNLVSKQLEHLENLERSETDPQTLEDFLRVDHLATRMRRNAESLLVLAGLESPRTFEGALPIRDVVRAAASEIADYGRVNLVEVDDALVRGAVGGDVIHLLAELIENAARFSSPDTTVDVFGRRHTTGYALFVVDHGVGMNPDRLAESNLRLQGNNDLTDENTAYLGLQVVGLLGQRHGIDVELSEPPHGGTSVRVVLPEGMLILNPGEEPLHDFDADSPLGQKYEAALALEGASPGLLDVSNPGELETTPSGFTPRVRADAAAPATVLPSSPEPPIAPPEEAALTPSGFRPRVPTASAAAATQTEQTESTEQAASGFGSFQQGVQAGHAELTADSPEADQPAAGGLGAWQQGTEQGKTALVSETSADSSEPAQSGGLGAWQRGTDSGRTALVVEPASTTDQAPPSGLGAWQEGTESGRSELTDSADTDEVNE